MVTGDHSGGAQGLRRGAGDVARYERIGHRWAEHVDAAPDVEHVLAFVKEKERVAYHEEVHGEGHGSVHAERHECAAVRERKE
jgi:hypothetical protein